jgi:hypothetical protein
MAGVMSIAGVFCVCIGRKSQTWSIPLMKATHLSSLQFLEWDHNDPMSFLNVNNLVFVLALASLLIMLNAISLVHQVHL